MIYYQKTKKRRTELKTKKKKEKVENPLTRVTRRKKREQAKLCGIFSRRDDAKFGVENGGFATPRNLPTTTSGEQNGVEETPYGGL